MTIGLPRPSYLKTTWLKSEMKSQQATMAGILSLLGQKQLLSAGELSGVGGSCRRHIGTGRARCTLLPWCARWMHQVLAAFLAFDSHSYNSCNISCPRSLLFLLGLLVLVGIKPCLYHPRRAGVQLAAVRARLATPGPHCALPACARLSCFGPSQSQHRDVCSEYMDLCFLTGNTSSSFSCAAQIFCSKVFYEI